MFGKSPAGYSLELCAKSQISSYKKKTGEMHVNMAWKEYKIDQVVSPEQILENESPILWGVGKTHEFPDSTHAVVLEIKYFDGTVASITNSYSDKYISINYNEATKQMQINSKKPSSIKDVY